MSRAVRLLDLIQLLRRYRAPVSAQRLAAELGVSSRTIYRDIESLVGQGAPIEGEAGLGYVLRAGFLLPPLTFTETETDALSLGLRWVMRRGDPTMVAAASEALVRIAAVLPAAMREGLDDNGLLAGPGPKILAETLDLAVMREAIRHQIKLRIAYADAGGALTERVVWPIALAFFDQVRVMVAWCELRQDYRHFRADRVEMLDRTPDCYPASRRVLLKGWREQQGLSQSRRGAQGC